MKYMLYGTVGLSYIVALALRYLVVRCGDLLSRLGALLVLGRASLVIMYSHMTVEHFARALFSQWLTIVTALIVGALLYSLLGQSSRASEILLGKRQRRRPEALASTGAAAPDRQSGGTKGAS